jgi:D-glycero-D-manno-heptose 1,7-bisphosphate phosphatase
MTAPSAQGAVFFDRDGCLNADRGYVHRWQDFHWLPGAKAAIRLVNDVGWLAFVVTNQSGVARGLYAADDVEALHGAMAADLARDGAAIAAFRYCPHHPDFPRPDGIGTCRCRKPAAGMIVDLMRAWRVPPSRAFLVGDQERDCQAAHEAGIEGYLVAPGKVLQTVRREVQRRS